MRLLSTASYADVNSRNGVLVHMHRININNRTQYYHDGVLYYQDGRTSLHYAACHNALNVAKLLIEKGADVNAIDSVCTQFLVICLSHNIPLLSSYTTFFILYVQYI